MLETWDTDKNHENIKIFSESPSWITLTQTLETACFWDTQSHQQNKSTKTRLAENSQNTADIWAGNKDIMKCIQLLNNYYI